MVRGGIPSVVFGNWMQGSLVGRGMMEDTATQSFTHPKFDDYWKTKRIPVENIEIPTYVLGSYSCVFRLSDKAVKG
jgi:predicted acyl esterase